MVLGDDQVIAGFVALGGAIVALSGAVVSLFVKDWHCQKRLGKLAEEFNLILDAIDNPPKRRRSVSGKHKTIR